MDVLKSSNEEARFCSACKTDTDSKWICCCCGIISCGRFVKGHALEHFKTSGHTISLDLESKAIHCYVCDDYINGGELETKVEKLRKTVTDVLAGLADSAEETTSPNGKVEHIIGLENLGTVTLIQGNTCYMNVVLQTLVATDQIKSHFLVPLTSPMTPLEHHKKRITKKASAAGTLWTQFRALLIEMYNSQESKLSPENFFTFMRKKLPSFVGYQQQDAQEFLRALLDQMHEELKSNKGKTLIMQIFQGQFTSEMTCGKCAKVSRKQEPFLDLSLSIPQPQKNEMVTIIDCINAFVALETLQDDDLYFCEVCKTLTQATKQMVLQLLPPILTLHLKRFRYYDNSRTKIDYPVRFPITLDMSQFLSNSDSNSDKLYFLYAVIVHRGTLGSGHYIAYVNNQGRWFEMNDRKTTEVTEDQVLGQSAYMLFYDLHRRQIPKLEPLKFPVKRKSTDELGKIKR